VPRRSIRVGHQDPHLARPHGLTRELHQRVTPVRIVDAPAWKKYPSAVGRLSFRIIAAAPVLHEIFRRVRIGPGDSDRRPALFAPQIENDPLRMRRIGVTREALRKVRIALPKRALVAIGESRVTDDISAVVAGNAPGEAGDSRRNE
jgi:hypothetical protein